MDPHQASLIEAAGRLGIAVERLDGWGLDAIRLTHAGQREIVLQGRIFPYLGAVADAVAADKQAARAMMRELGIPVPEAITLDAASPDKAGIDAFLKRHGVAVAKPLVGTDGQGIAMHLDSAEAVVAHLGQATREDDGWLLEQQADGRDLRLQALGGELVAACVRKPCSVTGDGVQSVRSLIEQRNRLIAGQNPQNRIDIDRQVERRLERAGLTLDSVLPDGEQLQIKDVSNMAQGGHAVDVTDDVHPAYRDYIRRIARALDLRLFSLDVMTPSPDADPERHAFALEFNAQPAWLHHTFSERRQHDIPGMLLRDLFGLPAS